MVLRVESMILQLVVFEVAPYQEKEEQLDVIVAAAPLFRIVGYDPRTKATSVFMAEPEYITQVAGGVHSGYLAASRRRELARIVCESLTVVLRRGKPFELSARQPASMKAIQGKKSEGLAEEEDQVPAFRRRGKIGRFAVNISGLHVILTFYSMQGIHPSKEGFNDDASHDLLVNIYSQQRSLSRDLIISTLEQMERIGKSVLSHKDGLARATALRHLSKFLSLSFENSSRNELSQGTVATLLPPSQEFLPHYENLKAVDPGLEPSPIGAPVVFLPLNTCGDLIHRRTANMSVEGEDRYVTFVISVHCKAPAIGPEKRLVMKLYESVSKQTVVLHIGPIQLDRSCSAAGRLNLLQDVAMSFIDTTAFRKLDATEQSLLGLTEKGEEVSRLEHLMQELVDVLLGDMGLRVGEVNTYVPFFLSAPKPI